MKPLISIITPAYNAELFIAETLNSVKVQTYPHWEHIIVVDVKSVDKTLDIVRSHAAQDSRIKIIQHPQAQGVSNNRNLAIQNARGSYLAFLDCDDIWHPSKLEMQLRFMEANGLQFSFHSYQQMQINGEKLNTIRKAPPTVTYKNLLSDNCIGCLTVMIKNNAKRKILFKEESHEDFCLWLDLLQEHKLAHGMPDVLAYYRLVPNSRSDNKKNAALWRWHILRRREQLGLLTSLYHFGGYVISALIYRFLRFT